MSEDTKTLVAITLIVTISVMLVATVATICSEITSEGAARRCFEYGYDCKNEKGE